MLLFPIQIAFLTLKILVPNTITIITCFITLNSAFQNNANIKISPWFFLFSGMCCQNAEFYNHLKKILLCGFASSFTC